MLMTESLNYFNAVDYLEDIKVDEAIAQMNEDFKNWLIDNYFLEAAPNNTQQLQQDKIPWQQQMITSIKQIVGQTAQWAYQQMPGDQEFMQQARDIILNTKQYPVKPTTAIKNATNYQSALQRLSMPLSTGLKGFDLSKVDDDAKANVALKKSLIPSYDGKSDFTQYAKLYYYGGEKNRANLSAQQVGMLLNTAFQFCQSYNTRIQSIQTDVNGIVNFIQQDPSSGQLKQQTQSDLSQIQQMQRNQAAQIQGMASTNPGANAGTTRPVNADTNFEYFMEHYFGPNWQELTEAGGSNKGVSPVTNPQQSKPTPPQTTSTPPQNASIVQQAKQDQMPNGAPVDTNALAQRKQQIAAGIVRDALAAKMAALSMVYRDFMFLMRTHVASYKGAAAANHGVTQPQQQQVPQQQG